MALFVQKFGGTSLATLNHINNAADIVAKAKQAGHDVVVIVSAMSGETDRLIQLAKDISESPDPREYASLVSTGEQQSMTLFAMALHNRGINACSYTGQQANIMTCNGFKKARIQSIDTTPIEQDIKQGKVIVIAGFQGVDKYGNITTLGRGGSDTTAVAIAASLKADECQIYTDVDGVYTTDPNMVPDARRLDRIGFEEMLELASQGAKVLQIRAVEFAGKYNVPVRVLSSSEEGPGTLISYNDDSMEKEVVAGIAFSRNEAKISILGIPDKPSIVSDILAELSKQGISIDIILQNQREDDKTDLTFTVHQEEYQPCIKTLRKVAKKIVAESVVGDANVSKVSIIGAGLQSHLHITPAVFQALAKKGINIQLISSSEIKISVIIDQNQLEEAVKVLHQTFKLENKIEDLSETLQERKLYLAAAKKS